MSRIVKTADPHIVSEFVASTGCKIRIADNYVEDTPDAVKKILDNVARIAMNEYRRNAAARDRAMHPEKYTLITG